VHGYPDQAKARRAIAVPLSKAAVVIIREQLGKHSTHVFTYYGKPVIQVNTKAWRQALQRAGIENFRWHDLRHTWASWHVQAGTPLHVLQELAGWESVEMVRRYAHLSSEHWPGMWIGYRRFMPLGMNLTATIWLRSIKKGIIYLTP